MDRKLARCILDDVADGLTDPFYRYISGYPPYDGAAPPMELPILGTSWRYLFLLARHEKKAPVLRDSLIEHASGPEVDWMTAQFALPPLTDEEGLELRKTVAKAYGRA